MNKEQFELLKNYKDRIIITVDDLIDTSDRVLILGYNIERDTFKIELKDKKFIKTIHKYGMDSTKHPIDFNEDFVPSKRVYPEESDFEFCQLLISRGVYIPFTTFTEK